MTSDLPFPDGHDKAIEKDLKIVSKGLLDATTKGKTITIKGFTEDDIREIREIILKEIKDTKAELMKWHGEKDIQENTKPNKS